MTESLFLAEDRLAVEIFWSLLALLAVFALLGFFIIGRLKTSGRYVLAVVAFTLLWIGTVFYVLRHFAKP